MISMPASLFEKLTLDCLILTANSRLARYLQIAYDDYQQKTVHVFETPRILPLATWLEQQFFATNTNGLILLTDFQEQCIWEEIVSQSSLTPELLQPTQMARLAKEAYAHLTLWQVPTEELEAHTPQLEVRCLMAWIKTFQMRCHQHRWSSICELPQRLKNVQKTPNLPRNIILIGFDDFNPSTSALLNHLKNIILIETQTLQVENTQRYRVILDNTETELLIMARWARAQLEKNPLAKIGCVIPDLGTLRTQVHRIFTNVFSIESILPGVVAEKLPFNISAGQPLTHFHMINTAFMVLNFCYNALSIDDIAQLLQSPYLCQNEAEANMGAQMDILLREENRLQITISDLFSVIIKLQTIYPKNSWLSRWRALLQIHHDTPKSKQSPSQWAQHFIQLLKAMHWPSGHTQISEEFQLLERFKKLCQEFSQLDFIFPAIVAKQALHIFIALAKQTIFQSKSHFEPIQIMGVLEASGILFDAVWVTGLHDIAWPAASKPHPLIPYDIQQRYQMPHATAKRELQFCEHMIKRLENSAKQVIFSSPAKAGDQLLFPSRLIQSIPTIDSTDIILSTENNVLGTIFDSRTHESFEDQTGSAVSDFSVIRGGSRILKLQAKCPFLAYATTRLNAKPCNTPMIGIPPAMKGILIHHILFEIWGELIEQKKLLALDDDALQTLIDHQIEKTFSTELKAHYLVQYAHFLSVEKKRLSHLLKAWFEFEKTRPPFRVIERETACHISIDSLPLQLRLDRVDELDDGTRLLIDYKTRENSVHEWLQERLTDPQLPLYAAFQATTEANYTSIGFAEIRSAQMTLTGLTHEDHAYAEKQFSKLKPIHKTKNELGVFSWDTLMQTWKESLTQLTKEFCAGIAISNPIEKTLCEQCDVKSLCRHGRKSTS